MSRLALVALLLGACTTAPPPAAPAPTPSGARADPTEAAPASLPTALRRLCRVGVEECDLYLALYWACLRQRFPGQADQEFEASFIAACERWRGVASSAADRAELAEGCVTAMARSRMEMPRCCWRRECLGDARRWHR